MSHSRLLPAEVAGCLHDRACVAQEDGRARAAEDDIGPASRGQHLTHCWRRDRTGAAHEERGGGPGAAQRRQETDHEQRICPARGALPRPEAGGDQGVGRACDNAPGHRAIALGVMVREGEGLLALRGVRRVSAIEPHRRRGLGRARKAVVHERGRKAGERGARHAMCASGERRGTREVLGRIERHTFSAQRKQGSGPATVGIMAVCIPRGHLVETLGEEGAQGGAIDDGCRLSRTAAAKRAVTPL